MARYPGSHWTSSSLLEYYQTQRIWQPSHSIWSYSEGELASATGYNSSSRSALSPLPETYSRKVFVGGLPHDIDDEQIKRYFIRFGPLTVDWPRKDQTRAYFPPKGYVFVIFEDELCVHSLIRSCIVEDEKLFMYLSSVTQANKRVQIKPWRLSDSNFIMDPSHPIDPRKTIFVGGVPRPMKASELADIFNSSFGSVCYAGIDYDSELKYPKGSGRVTFFSRVSFTSAVSTHLFQMTYGDIDKKVEIKPYVLDDQVCDECHGLYSPVYAPYFCGNIHCLRYYCHHCWASVHCTPGTKHHLCFIKQNRERPRIIKFFSSLVCPPHPIM